MGETTMGRFTAAGFAAALLCVGLACPSAYAVYYIDFQQVGADVVATGSGSIHLDGFAFGGTGTGGTTRNFVYPSFAAIGIGASPNQDLYGDDPTPENPDGRIIGDGYYGTGLRTLSTSNTGDAVQFHFNLGFGSSVFFVPAGYVSDAPLSGSSTWANQTFASLGLLPGTYIWRDRGYDVFIWMNIPEGTIPEPATCGLTAFASLGLLVRRRRIHRG
jgi:hypothetical protein